MKERELPPAQRPRRLKIALCCGYRTACPELVAWCFQAGVELATRWREYNLQPSGVDFGFYLSSRILMNRNLAAADAIDGDLLLFVDPDMVPDIGFGTTYRLPDAIANRQKRFLESSLLFLSRHPASIVGAPAIRDGDLEYNVFVHDENGQRRITRAEAEQRLASPCIEEVAAVGTGLMLIDMAAIRRLTPPWFNDVYDDGMMTSLHASQDVWFCDRARQAGCHIFCNWYAPCGHVKSQVLVPGVSA
jgi:hypothetical protein